MRKRGKTLTIVYGAVAAATQPQRRGAGVARPVARPYRPRRLFLCVCLCPRAIARLLGKRWQVLIGVWHGLWLELQQRDQRLLRGSRPQRPGVHAGCAPGLSATTSLLSARGYTTCGYEGIMGLNCGGIRQKRELVRSATRPCGLRNRSGPELLRKLTEAFGPIVPSPTPVAL